MKYLTWTLWAVFVGNDKKMLKLLANQPFRRQSSDNSDNSQWSVNAAFCTFSSHWAKLRAGDAAWQHVPDISSILFISFHLIGSEVLNTENTLSYSSCKVCFPFTGPSWNPACRPAERSWNKPELLLVPAVLTAACRCTVRCRWRRPAAATVALGLCWGASCRTESTESHKSWLRTKDSASARPPAHLEAGNKDGGV